MLIEILLYNVVITALLLAAVENYKRKKKIHAIRSMLYRQIGELRKRVSALFEMTDVLNAHAGRYFSALNDAGLSRLVDLREKLKIATDDCELLFSQQQYVDAKRILRFLLSPSFRDPPILRNPVNADLSDLIDWEQESNDLLLKCAIVLKESSSVTDQLGIVRPGKRRRTYHTLELLREMLPK